MSRRGRSVWRVLRDILLFGSTVEVRFVMAMASFAYAAELALSDGGHKFGMLTLLTPPFADPNVLWSVSFAVYGVALIAGMTGRYGVVSLMFEAVLGMSLWTTVAIVGSLSHAYISHDLGAALIATWLFVRYPTHYRRVTDV